MILFERRASGILYNLLRSLPDDGPFLLPANVCPVVPLTFHKATTKFRFVDLDEEDLGMDQRRCLELLSRSPQDWAGVLYVRPYGATVAGVADFFRALKDLRSGLLVIDDRCLCPPDGDGERLAPSADVTLFSTGDRKPVDLGIGGFAHCHEEVVYRRHDIPYAEEALARVIRRYKEAIAGRTPWRGEGEDWLDLAPPALAWDAYRASIHEALPAAEQSRQMLNAVYAAALPQEIQLPARFHGWRFNILVPEPHRLVESLFAAGLFASRHYASLGGVFCADRFPVAERLHRGVVNLFNDRNFDEERARRAVDCVLGHLARV